MTCGIFWLLLISPPLNAKAYETRLPWLGKQGQNDSLEQSLSEGSEPPLLAELGDEGTSLELTTSTALLSPVDPDPELVSQVNQT